MYPAKYLCQTGEWHTKSVSSNSACVSKITVEPTTLLPYGSDESTEVYGKWTDNVLVFYGYDVIASAL